MICPSFLIGRYLSVDTFLIISILTLCGHLPDKECSHFLPCCCIKVVLNNTTLLLVNICYIHSTLGKLTLFSQLIVCKNFNQFSTYGSFLVYLRTCLLVTCQHPPTPYILLISYLYFYPITFVCI